MTTQQIKELKEDIAFYKSQLENPVLSDKDRDEIKAEIEEMEGELAEAEKPAAKPKAAAKKAAPKKAAPAKKPVSKTAKPAKEAAPKPMAKKPTPKSTTTKPSAYTWRKPTDDAKLKPVTIHCDHYALEVTEDTLVSLKGTGDATVRVTAKKGEFLIFDGDRRLLYVMQKAAYDKKCNEKRSVAAHKAAEHDKPAPKAATPDKPTKKAPAVKKPAAKASVTVKKAPAKKAAPKKRAKAPSARSSRLPAYLAHIEKDLLGLKKAKSPKDIDEWIIKLAAKSQSKNYLNYVRTKLRQAKDEGVTLTKHQVEKLGLLLLPLVQKPSGIRIDQFSGNKKVLPLTLDGLLRWSESPGRYDLPGVDDSDKAKPTIKKPKQPKPSTVLSFLGIS